MLAPTQQWCHHVINRLLVCRLGCLLRSRWVRRKHWCLPHPPNSQQPLPLTPFALRLSRQAPVTFSNDCQTPLYFWCLAHLACLCLMPLLYKHLPCAVSISQTRALDPEAVEPTVSSPKHSVHSETHTPVYPNQMIYKCLVQFVSSSPSVAWTLALLMAPSVS